MNPESHRRQLGVTLIELVVVMSLLALAMTLVAPGVGRTVDNMRLRSFGRQVRSAFQMASVRARMDQASNIISFDERHFRFLHSDGSSAETLDLPDTIIAVDDEALYLVTPSGHVLGPDTFVFRTQGGREGVIRVGIDFGVRFTEGSDDSAQ